MKVKKYRASSMPEVMKLIRSDLGHDAVILNSRIIQTGGFLGFFKKRSIEVIAALDNKTFEPVMPITKEKAKNQETFPSIKGSHVESSIDKSDPIKSLELQEEIKEIKALLHHVQIDTSNDGFFPLPSPIQELKQQLHNQEMNQKEINEVVKAAMEWWYKNGEEKTHDEVIRWAKNYLINQIAHLPFGEITFSKKYINIVGPTGVGKTTTLAKIAAISMLKHKKNIAFITTDTYRIAAIEQLKTYANILNVPVEVCYNLEDFHNAVKKFASCDLVFIDTAGRNFRNRKYVEDLKNIIDFNQDIETLLVLSLTSKQTDMEEIISQFSLMTVDKLIFTKADETSTYGAMYNVIKQKQKAVAYITNGQNVPDDFVKATPENVVNHIVGVDQYE
jgi:flagellar biosynthesis protein FlhF